MIGLGEEIKGNVKKGRFRFEAKVQEWKLPLLFTAPATSAERDHQECDGTDQRPGTNGDNSSR